MVGYGQRAHFQHCRPATVTTLLGPLTITRPSYLCAACRQGHAPADAQLQICAGSRSAGLDHLLALLGTTQESFAEAATVLKRLTLVHVSPTTVRDATATLGAAVVAQQAQQGRLLQAGTPPPASPTPPPSRLCVLMDGVLAHLHEQGWSEIKVGCCYTTHLRPDGQRPERLAIHAQQLSYVVALAEAETVGWHRWYEAARRSVLKADEVVVLGDGAHWIWKIADELFPQAMQILDW
ncbi:MAG: hypothetical protein KatS3mg057_0899 [Herpetosiphonaceae bacterium]|nr:MAG: hypothetical protein KatS3mg057_0899 [Herpetosiphonaceae bacterium]